MPKGQSQRPRYALNKAEQAFVKEFLRTGVATKSAAAAGYHPTHCTDLMRNPLVAAAVAKGREKVAEKLSYGLEAAMAQAQEAYEFAKETENANAMVKAAELRAKLNGLLVEKIDIRQKGFVLNIASLAGPAPLPALPDVPVDAVDVTPIEETDDDDIFS